MRVSVTSTVICVDKVLSSSLDRLSDADSSQYISCGLWTSSVPRMTQVKVSQKLDSVVKSMLRAEAATC